MKILASDYDGTLNYGGIDDKKRVAISRWRSADNLFGLVSGRNLDDLVTLLVQEQLECDFLVANNGAVIAMPDGTVLDDVRCEGSIALPLMKLLFELGCPFIRIGAQSFYYVRLTTKDCTPGDIPFSELPPLAYFNQISTMCADEAKALAVSKEIDACFHDYVMPLPNRNWVDIVPKGVDKAQGLYRLLAHYQIPAENVIAVGDSANDISMIATFHSYAMENAESSVLNMADSVTRGVAELIERELEFINLHLD